MRPTMAYWLDLLLRRRLRRALVKLVCLLLLLAALVAGWSRKEEVAQRPRLSAAPANAEAVSARILAVGAR